MRLLAVDQSTVCTAFSLWDDGNLMLVNKIRPKYNKDTDIYQKFEIMYYEFDKIIKEYKPDYICIEGVQFQRNYKVYSTLSQLQGVLMSVIFKNDLGLYIVEPSVWKSHIHIKSRKRAEQKEETINYVKNHFNLSVSEDEADSIGIGIWAKDHIGNIH